MVYGARLESVWAKVRRGSNPLPSAKIMDQIEFLNNVRKILSKETSFDPDNWTEDNPFYGHCAVVTLLAQDFFGGEILRGSLKKTPFSAMNSHYWNLIISEEKDFTEEQFKGNKPKLISKIRKKESLLSNNNTLQRYQLLKSKFLDLES